MTIVLTLAELTASTAPFAMVALLTMDPCTPPFLLSMSDRCGEMGRMNLEIFVVLFEAWIVMHMFGNGIPWVCYILFAGIVVILDYFELLKG